LLCSVTFWVAALMLMPDAPRINVLPGVIVSAPPGEVTWMPCQLRLTPSATVFAPVTVLFQTATSPAPGAAPPLQPPPKLRLVVLSALMIGTASARGGANCKSDNKTAVETIRRGARERHL